MNPVFRLTRRTSELGRNWRGSLIAATLAVLLVLGGCSSSGQTKAEKDSHVAIPPGSTLSIDVTPSEEIAGEEDAAEAITELRTQLFGRAMSSGRFAAVVPSGQAADYSLDVKLTGARRVSGAARVFFGVLAGSNTLSADVRFYQNSPRELLDAFTSSSSSASHPMSSENSMADAIRELVDEIEKGFQG